MPRNSTDVRQPVAYSYIRFSTLEQRKGDSLRRQTEGAADWCKRNNVTLDTSKTLHDLGKSAFTGKHRTNPDRHALASFLALVQRGEVPHGSFLVIENLDRLSREHIQPAMLLTLNLLQAGIRIVQLKPAEMVFDDKSDTMPVMMMMMELSRGHGESAMKSECIGKAWAEKKQAAREGRNQPPRKIDRRVTRSLTDRLPGWVEERNGKLCLIPAAAAIVRRIFQMAVDGYGAPSIIKKLTAEGVPSIGRTSRWTRAYIGTILNGRRVLGEYQPRDRSGKPVGDPIPGYYPAVVSEDEWLAARAAVQQRRRFRGRVGKAQVNIFAHLLRHARDGDDTYILATRLSRSTGKTFSILVNTEGDQGKTRGYSLPYAVFETAVLSCLREIDPHDILNGDHPPDETTTLAGEMVGIEAELAEAATFMEANGFSPTIGKRIADLEARRKELAERLADARTAAAHPLSESWGECQSLVDTLAAAADPHDARLRLRSALRRIVVGMRLLIVARNQVRLAAVQFDFGGKHNRRRTYLLLYRPSGRVRPGEWRVRSWTDEQLRKAMMPEQFDLRHADPTCLGEDDEGRGAHVAGWQDVERDLLAADVDDLFVGCERHPLP
jgi:DNA invertase Pin-like site-specific DNA recombinase